MTIDHTPPSADELRGLESMCAVLHAATETDPVVKDVAWRAFALIRAHRSLIETAHNQARMLGEITDACMAAEGDALRHRTQVAELSAEVQRLKVALAKEEETSNRLIDERDHMEKLLDTFAYTLAPEEVIGEHSSGNDPWQNALDLVTSVAEVDRLRELAAERDKAVEDAQHMAGAMAKVGPALLEALRLAAAGDAAGAAAVLGDVAPEAPEEGGEVRG